MSVLNLNNIQLSKGPLTLMRNSTIANSIE